MKQLLGKLLKSIENTNISFISWVISLFAIITIRNLFENLSSNKARGDFLTPPTAIFIHFPLFYITTLLLLILIFYWLLDTTKRDIVKITKVFFVGFILIWLTPIIDLILTLGRGQKIMYMTFDPKNPFTTFLFLQTMPEGITNGIRLELILIFVFIAIYFFWKSKNILYTFINFLINYISFSLLLSAQSLLILLENLSNHRIISNKIYNADLVNVISLKKFLSQIPNINLYSGTNYAYVNSTIWDILLSWFWIILAVTLLNTWFYLYNRTKFFVFWKNSRPKRLLYYFSLIFVGFFIAYKFGLNSWKWSPFNTFNFIVLIISLTSSWLLQVNINDIYDRQIDTISNPNRPLVTHTLLINDLHTYNIIIAIIIILSIFLLNYEILMFILAWNALYFIYSSPPFRLKRIAFISNLLLGIIGAVTISAGFSLASGGLWFNRFPNTLLFFLIIIITLISHVKDIKDVTGDNAFSIKTIPVVLGIKNGKRVISAMVFLASIMIILLVNSLIFEIFSVLTGLFAVFLINRQKFNENYLFLLFFIYLIILFRF